jgi:hypothetical protein
VVDTLVVTGYTEGPNPFGYRTGVDSIYVCAASVDSSLT